MASVEYRELPLDEIDAIEPLWRKLNEHHVRHSTYFAPDFRKIEFQDRIHRLRRDSGRLRIVVAGPPGGEPVGYAIGSITETHTTRRGQLDSMYVEAEWRGHGIGKELATRILDWIDENGITNVIIAVAAGNEQALEFYDRLGFAPRAVTLRRKPAAGRDDPS